MTAFFFVLGYFLTLKSFSALKSIVLEALEVAAHRLYYYLCFKCGMIFLLLFCLKILLNGAIFLVSIIRNIFLAEETTYDQISTPTISKIENGLSRASSNLIYEYWLRSSRTFYVLMALIFHLFFIKLCYFLFRQTPKVKFC